jgi:hypothetical protein
MPYVYAVTEAAAPSPPPELFAVRHGALAAIVAGHEAPDPTPEALRRHEAVVEGLMGERPLLPMRFGSTSGDVAALLVERHDELLAALERVRGAVEVGVRPGEDATAATGTEYLMRRVAVERVHESLAGLARESVRGAYLVDKHAVARFAARVRELDPGLVCTGPWPPWSFCGS